MNVMAPKLVLSEDLPSGLEQYAQIYEDTRQPGFKQASELIFKVPLDQLRPTDKNKVGIHIVALGDWEHYGLNKNGDGFPRKPCMDFHNTFVTHGALYQLHKNKDFSKRLGEVVASAYNPDAFRIEVFVHADRDKAEPYLTQIERNGTYPFSMAAFVPWDECTVCKHRRWFNETGTVCEHVKDHLSHVWPDGTAVGTLNWLPTFHDISFVPRGADRIAYDLGLYIPGEKAASHVITTSLERAKRAGLMLRGAESPKIKVRRGLLSKLAAIEDDLRADRSGAHVMVGGANHLTVADIDQLRHYEPRTMFKVASENNIIFSFPQFCRLVYGDQVPAEMSKVASHGVFTVANADPDYCLTETYFDVDPGHRNIYANTTHVTVDGAIQGMKAAAEMTNQSIKQRIMSTISQPTKMGQKLASVSPEASACANAYAAYAMNAIFHQKAAGDRMVLCAVAAQNLNQTRS